MQIEFDGQEQGVSVKFKTSAVVHACPDSAGAFTIEAMVDLRTSNCACCSWTAANRSSIHCRPPPGH